MTTGDSDEQSVLDRRRASYRQLVDGELASGDGDRYTFLVRSVDLRNPGADLVAAAGLGLALVERGHGVRLVPQHRWHLGGSTDVWVAATPEVDPSLAPADAWKVAWAHDSIDEWAALDHLVAFDRVLCGSEIGRVTLLRRTPRATEVLRTGVDAELFVPAAGPREEVVSIGVHVDRGRSIQPLITDLALQVPLTVHAEPVRNMRGGLLGRLEAPVAWLRAPEVLRHRPAQRHRDAGVRGGQRHPVRAGLRGTRLRRPARAQLPARCGRGRPRAPDVHHVRGAGRASSPRCVRTRRAPLHGRPRSARACSTPTRGTTGPPQLDGLVRARLHSEQVPPPAKALHYFPDYNRANPYQGMLFAGLDAVDAYPVAVTDVISHLENRAVSAVPGTINIHWTTPILQYAAGPYRAAIELDRFSAALHKFRAAGGRLVWTLHNVLPHEAKHVWAETQLAQLLADRADTIHALAEITARQASEVLRLDPRKVVVIEHSSYLGRYPQWISREAARAQLGFGPDDKVLVALGGIRPYKGLGRLLDVFHELADDDPSAPAAGRRQAGADAGDGRSQATLRAVTAGDLGVLPRARRPAPGLVRRRRPRRAALLAHPQLRRLLAGPDLRAADRRSAHRRPARPGRRAARAPLQPARRPLAQGDPAGRRPRPGRGRGTTRRWPARPRSPPPGRAPRSRWPTTSRRSSSRCSAASGPPTGDGVTGP